MDNIVTELKGDKLIITVDVSAATIARSPRSASGKSKTIATSHGHTSVNGNGLSLNLNVNYKDR